MGKYYSDFTGINFGMNFANNRVCEILHLIKIKSSFMKTQLQNSTAKATKGISNAIAFVLALSIALSLGFVVLFTN
jgi:hypothetical protein